MSKCGCLKKRGGVSWCIYFYTLEIKNEMKGQGIVNGGGEKEQVRLSEMHASALACNRSNFIFLLTLITYGTVDPT